MFLAFASLGNLFPYNYLMVEDMFSYVLLVLVAFFSFPFFQVLGTYKSFVNIQDGTRKMCGLLRVIRDALGGSKAINVSSTL